MEARLAAAAAALSVATVAAAFAPASCMLRPTVHGSRPWASLRAHSARRMLSEEVPARRVLPRALAKPLHRDMGFGPCPCGLELRSTLDCANALLFRDATSPQMAPGQCFRRGLVRAALSLMLVLGVGLVRPAAGHAANANKGDITESWVCIANGESNNAAPSSLAMRAGNHLAFASADRNPGYVQRSDQPGVTAGKARPAFVTTHDWKGLIGERHIGKKIDGWFTDVKQWLQFQSYELLAHNPIVKLVVFTLGSVFLVFFGGWLLRTSQGSSCESWSESLFKSYALLMNVAGADATGENTAKTALAVNAIFLTGCLTFAILLGIVTSTIENALNHALSGQHKVVARDHIVMANWGDKSGPMLRQMESAVMEGRISANTPVVVLANRDKESMEASVKEALSHNSPLKVHTRSGNPALFSDLEVASAGDAKYVLFNKPVGSDVVIHDLKERVLTQTAAVQALEAERQPGVKVGNAAGDIRMIVNGYGADELENDALPGITIMPKGDFSRRLLSCSTAQPGLSNVYSQIFDQGEGSEIYMYSVDRFPWLKGKTFAELPAHFPNAIVLGWTDLLQDKMMMNPPLDAKIGIGNSVDRKASGSALFRVKALNTDMQSRFVDSEHLVLLSKTNRITCLKNPAKSMQLHPEKRRAAFEKWSPFTKTLRDAHVRPAIRVVVLDDAVEAEMLEDLAGQLSPKSKVVTLSKAHPNPDMGRVQHNHITGSSLSLESVRRVQAGRSDVVVIRSDGETESSQERDGRVLAKTRLVLLARLDTPKNALKPLRLVVQVQTDETGDKLQNFVDELGDDMVQLEVVNTAKLSSGAIVQVLWNPELRGVYLDLMDTHGSEISMVDASFFTPNGNKILFGDLSDLAMQNKAVALGVYHSNGNLVLSPQRNDMFELNPGDSVVIFADTL